MIPVELKLEDIKNYWPRIRTGLEKILLKDPVQNWIPEDVYTAIQNKKVVCVLGLDGEELVGFFIGYKMKDNSFFTWVVWTDGDLAEGIEHLVSYAKQLSCTQVKFGTGRKGWDRVARRFGFQPSIWTLNI